MCEQRLGFINRQAMDDAISRRIQTCANRFGKVGMVGQNQNGFHRATKEKSLFLIAVTECKPSHSAAVWSNKSWHVQMNHPPASSFPQSPSFNVAFLRNSVSLEVGGADSGWSGRCNVNVLPRPGRLLASILPP